MGHLIQNVDISKPLTHTTPYTLSAICPVQWKPGFIREENTSPKCQTPSNVSICPLKSVTTTKCSQVETPMRTTSMQISFPETVSDSLCRNSKNRLLQQLSGWLVSDDLGGEDAGCGGPGLVWLHMVCGCEAGWMYCQILWNAFGERLSPELYLHSSNWTTRTHCTNTTICYHWIPSNAHPWHLRIQLMYNLLHHCTLLCMYICVHNVECVHTVYNVYW